MYPLLKLVSNLILVTFPIDDAHCAGAKRNLLHAYVVLSIRHCIPIHTHMHMYYTFNNTLT